MAAGSLCGIVITPLLIGIASDEEVTPATLLATAAAINSSMNSSDATLFTTTTYKTLSTTQITTTRLVDGFVSQLMSSFSPCLLND